METWPTVYQHEGDVQALPQVRLGETCCAEGKNPQWQSDGCPVRDNYIWNELSSSHSCLSPFGRWRLSTWSLGQRFGLEVYV